MRIELEETALVRPSNDDSPRGAGSAGSTTIAERPLESSAEASARPTRPPPKMIASARSTPTPYPARRNDATTSLDRGVRVRDSKRELWGWDDGNRGDTRTEGRVGA